MKTTHITNQGFIAISTILVISVVVLAIALTVTYLAIGEGQTALAQSKGEDALQFSEGCMEDALLKIRSNPSYAGGTISRPEGTCTITVVKAGNVYTVTSTAAGTLYKRSIQVVVTRASSLVITSWQEL